ncbi:MAG TPA: pyridoxamine 5'-phosphate oxidase [Aeromicrobium sp.]|nr:pyridoxamine 5'-phosphate oxidase [Aeromicrobium sp.]
MADNDLAKMRSEYASTGLDEETAGHDPVALARRWLHDAIAARVAEPNAMALATSTASGMPSVRLVLLKGLDETGAVFYTNYDSRKGRELAENPNAAAVMIWHQIGRQLRFEGPVRKLAPAECDEYFNSRPLGARISAASSPQSHTVANRAELERRWRETESAGVADCRPTGWGGYRIEIEAFEFWHGREDRLHDRVHFSKVGDHWTRERLAP